MEVQAIALEPQLSTSISAIVTSHDEHVKSILKPNTKSRLLWDEQSKWMSKADKRGMSLKIRALVSDGASLNRKFYRMHAQVGVPVEQGPVYSTPHPYDPERQMYFTCDPPHLIKTARNNFENSGWHNRTRLLEVSLTVVIVIHFPRDFLKKKV